MTSHRERISRLPIEQLRTSHLIAPKTATRGDWFRRIAGSNRGLVFQKSGAPPRRAGNCLLRQLLGFLDAAPELVLVGVATRTVLPAPLERGPAEAGVRQVQAGGIWTEVRGAPAGHAERSTGRVAVLVGPEEDEGPA